LDSKELENKINELESSLNKKDKDNNKWLKEIEIIILICHKLRNRIC
jgi:hypothetical protein